VRLGIVWAVTCTSYALRVLALVAMLPPWYGLLGVALDAADGALARRWDVATRTGAELDYAGDAGAAFLAAPVLLRAAWPISALGAVSLALLPLAHAFARAHKIRVSGSAPLVVAALFA